MPPTLKSALLVALHEYSLIVIPVALYIVIHGRETSDPMCSILHSPEWNIATIFLVAQGQALYRAELDKISRRRSVPALGLIGMAAVVLLVLATSNIHWAFDEPTPSVRIITWLLFAISSFSFLGFITGVRLVASGEQHDQS